ncbi:transketolase family protein [Patescibacteria group bacterium]
MMLLAKNLFTKNVNMEPTRNGYGEGLLEAGKKNRKIVALCADLNESTRTHLFAKKFPERYFEVGVAEQNLATVAAGMATEGMIPFITSYATFSPGRNLEQIRTTASYNNANVKIVGSHAGVSVGPDGATHQATEDIAQMRSIPNMNVVYPCDSIEAKKATLAIAKTKIPTYIRLAREKSPVMTVPSTPFKIGKAEVFQEGVDVTIAATGPLLYEALLAARKLQKKLSCEVVNFHTIKPLDAKTLVASAKKTGAVVTVEEHQKMGGFGSAITEVLAQQLPTPVEMIGLDDTFGESGPSEKLQEKYELTSPAIIKAIEKVITRK